MLSSQIKSNEIVFGNCYKDLLEEIIYYGIGLGADFVEIFIENTDNSSVLAEEDFITSVSPSFGRGAGIRIFKDKKVIEKNFSFKFSIRRLKELSAPPIYE